MERLQALTFGRAFFNLRRMKNRFQPKNFSITAEKFHLFREESGKKPLFGTPIRAFSAGNHAKEALFRASLTEPFLRFSFPEITFFVYFKGSRDILSQAGLS